MSGAWIDHANLVMGLEVHVRGPAYKTQGERQASHCIQLKCLFGPVTTLSAPAFLGASLTAKSPDAEISQLNPLPLPVPNSLLEAGAWEGTFSPRGF